MLTHEELHELTAACARLSAILSLLRDPTTRTKLDAEQVDQDVRAALEKFTRIWTSASGRGKESE